MDVCKQYCTDPLFCCQFLVPCVYLQTLKAWKVSAHVKLQWTKSIPLNIIEIYSQMNKSSTKLKVCLYFMFRFQNQKHWDHVHVMSVRRKCCRPGLTDTKCGNLDLNFSIWEHVCTVFVCLFVCSWGRWLKTKTLGLSGSRTAAPVAFPSTWIRLMLARVLSQQGLCVCSCCYMLWSEWFRMLTF